MDSTLSLSEKVSLGLMTTGIGILVVFAALLLIIVVIMILTQILKERKKVEEKKEEISAHVPEPEPVSQQNDDALPAVIAAAVAAYLDGEKQSGLVIKSYRKVNADNPWAQAGRNAQIYNKL